jgi:hypothetical protein
MANLGVRKPEPVQIKGLNGKGRHFIARHSARRCGIRRD